MQSNGTAFCGIMFGCLWWWCVAHQNITKKKQTNKNEKKTNVKDDCVLPLSGQLFF